MNTFPPRFERKHLLFSLSKINPVNKAFPVQIYAIIAFLVKSNTLKNLSSDTVYA